MFTVVCFHTRVQIHLHYSQEFAAHIAYDVALTVHFLLPFRAPTTKPQPQSGPP